MVGRAHWLGSNADEGVMRDTAGLLKCKQAWRAANGTRAGSILWLGDDKSTAGTDPGVLARTERTGPHLQWSQLSLGVTVHAQPAADRGWIADGAHLAHESR